MVAPLPIRLHQSGRAYSNVTTHEGVVVHKGFVTDVSRERDPLRPPSDTTSPKGWLKTDTDVLLELTVGLMNTVPTIFCPSKDTMDDRKSSKKATA
jgi:hypothetical protein